MKKVFIFGKRYVVRPGSIADFAIKLAEFGPYLMGASIFAAAMYGILLGMANYGDAVAHFLKSIF